MRRDPIVISHTFFMFSSFVFVLGVLSLSLFASKVTRDLVFTGSQVALRRPQPSIGGRVGRKYRSSTLARMPSQSAHLLILSWSAQALLHG